MNGGCVVIGNAGVGVAMTDDEGVGASDDGVVTESKRKPTILVLIQSTRLQWKFCATKVYVGRIFSLYFSPLGIVNNYLPNVILYRAKNPCLVTLESVVNLMFTNRKLSPPSVILIPG